MNIKTSYMRLMFQVNDRNRIIIVVPSQVSAEMQCEIKRVKIIMENLKITENTMVMIRD